MPTPRTRSPPDWTATPAASAPPGEPGARGAESRDEVALLVAPLVGPGRHAGDRNADVLEFPFDASDSFRGGQQADRRDVIGPSPHEEIDRNGKCAAGGKHRVEYVALSAGEIVGKTLGIRLGFERFLVADHAEESDFGRRAQALHSVKHAEPGTKNRNDQGFRVRQSYARGLGNRRLHLDRLDSHVAGRLIREQSD